MTTDTRWHGWCSDHAGINWSPERCELDTCPGSRPFPELSREYGQPDAARLAAASSKVAAWDRDDALEMEI